MQDQDHSVQDQDQDRFFWSQTGLVLRPSVSDHITGQLSSVIMGLSRAVSEINTNFPIHVGYLTPPLMVLPAEFCNATETGL